ncbi:sulfotransferase domain-containing protein [Candidatus Pelagibacter sp.]|nr:sulfotransferase domain-containing protein [Candidatus Pelagibacter sp.]
MIIWLSSYPKSGNTWLRSLLASYYFSKEGDFNFNLLKYIDQFPSYNFFKNYDKTFINPTDTAEFWIEEQEKINSNNKIKFFKTHNALCKINNYSFTDSKNTLAAIYIIRDPRNVITSLANHYEIDADQAFEFMITEQKAITQKKENSYVGFVALFSWIFHQESWTNNKLFPTLVIRYEDLQNETFLTLKKVINFIEKQIKSKNSFNRDKAKKSIQSCDFERLKKLEINEGFNESPISKKDNSRINFFKLGKDNDYKKLLTDELISKMNLKFKNEIKKFNYE